MNRFCLLAVCLLCLPTRGANAQSTPPDQVWLAPSKTTDADSGWYPRSVKTMSGRVVSLDTKQLVLLLTGDEAPTRIAAHRVIWIEPGKLGEKQSAALKLFAEKEYAAAVTPLIDATDQRPPVWRQTWLLMLAAFAGSKSSRGEIALELVSQIDQYPLAPYVLAWLPVAWNNQRQPAASIEAARKRLEDDSPAVRLVAASWLLSTPYRSEASKSLARLRADSARPFLAQLATTLLWRIATPPQVTENARTWQQQLDELPLVLQTGPTILLRAKFEAAGLDRQAKMLDLSLQLTRSIPFPIQ